MTDTVLQNTCLQIATVAATVTGTGTAPQYPPEANNQTVFVLTYPQMGDMDISSEGSRHSLWDFYCDVLVKHNDSTVDLQTLIGFLDPLKNAFSAEISSGGDQFSNAIETFLSLHVEFIPNYDYQSVLYFCYRFVLKGVKFIQAGGV